MLKTKIDKNDVIDIINQIDPLINDGKYEDAVKLFAELDLSFGKLNESDKKELNKAFEDEKKLLLVYYKIFEGESLMKFGDIRRIKDVVHDLDYMKGEYRELLTEKQKLLDHLEQSKKAFLEFYDYANSRRKFYVKMMELHSLIAENKIGEAKRLYRKLIRDYNVIVNYLEYHKRKEIYNELMEIYRDITTKNYKTEVYKTVLKPIKIERKEIKKDKVENIKPIYYDPYREVRDLISNNDLENANKLLKTL
ncbi:MAG TPA: hypothetical protein VJJ23_04595 [Candidatus Nanoarchaeia archaeon]|nr:hypothetical protein [Candidatus Nanoarchaeia archaeon]